MATDRLAPSADPQAERARPPLVDLLAVAGAWLLGVAIFAVPALGFIGLLWLAAALL